MTKQCSSRSDASELCLTVHTIHRRRKVKKTGGGGGGGARFRILGAKGGRIPSRHMTS